MHYIKKIFKMYLMKLLIKIGEGYQSVYGLLLTKVPLDWREICVFTSAAGT
jgi:hypothetical protein